MSVRYHIVLTKTSDGSRETCAGEITDRDWLVITRFCRLADRLRASDWVRAGLNSQYSIENGVVVTPNAPTDGMIFGVLHLLRPFVLKKAATHFPKVTGLLWRYLDHPYLRALLTRHRDGFANGYGRAYYTVSINELVLNDERTLTLWLNAFEYHQDEDKEEQLNAAFGGPPDALALAVIKSLIADKVSAVLAVADFLDELAASRTAVASNSAP